MRTTKEEDHEGWGPQRKRATKDEGHNGPHSNKPESVQGERLTRLNSLGAKSTWDYGYPGQDHIGYVLKWKDSRNKTVKVEMDLRPE